VSWLVRGVMVASSPSLSADFVRISSVTGSRTTDNAVDGAVVASTARASANAWSRSSVACNGGQRLGSHVRLGASAPPGRPQSRPAKVSMVPEPSTEGHRGVTVAPLHGVVEHHPPALARLDREAWCEVTWTWDGRHGSWSFGGFELPPDCATKEYRKTFGSTPDVSSSNRYPAIWAGAG
jgi:hypothetical protein